MHSRYLLILLPTILACTSGNRPNPATPPQPSSLSGQELATIHCSSCHLFPAPDMLDQKTWKNGVLPEMAYRLGMRPLTEKMGDIGRRRSAHRFAAGCLSRQASAGRRRLAENN